jgi:phosphohistidine phosphatase SixA
VGVSGVGIVRQLYLLRHAKSDWDHPKLDDHDRPLAPRGKKAMKAMARYLRREGIHPDVVLCSSAKRARQTLERVLPALGDGVDLEVEDDLYTFDADVLLARLKRVPTPRRKSWACCWRAPALRRIWLGSARGSPRVGSPPWTFPSPGPDSSPASPH